MRRLLPTSLFARLAAVLVLAVVAQFVASTVLFEQAELVTADDAETERFADALDTAVRVLDATPPPQRAATATALSHQRFAIGWPAASTPDDAPRGPAASDPAPAPASLAARLVAIAPGLAARGIALGNTATRGTALRDPGGGALLRGSARLADGSRLSFTVPRPGDSLPAFWSTLASVAILSGFVLLAALTVARTLAAPLRTLAAAADAIGAGPLNGGGGLGATLGAAAVAVAGPGETRRLAEAFNAMQRRIERLIADRTQALAAVSHDLRTPIARMRLRCGLIPDSDDRRALGDDLGEMEAMIASLAAYLRGDADPEARRRTDLAAMLQTLVDDAADAGRIASYEGPARHVVTVRPLATKRALANVVNNALAYGGRASVALSTGAGTVVTVEDEGPGVPEAELERVFEPFHRLDGARSPAATGNGMGLGLAIARQAVGREGGTVALGNRREGGLRVTIAYPDP